MEDKWKYWADIATAFVAAALIIVLASSKSIWPERSGDWAAWVQAIGTFAAIVGTAWIGRRQADRATALQRERRLIDHEERVKRILAICTAANSRSREIMDCIDNGKVDDCKLALTYRTSMLDRMVQVLDTIPEMEIGNANAIKSLILMKESIISLGSVIEQYRKERQEQMKTRLPTDNAEHIATDNTVHIKQRDELQSEYGMFIVHYVDQVSDHYRDIKAALGDSVSS